MRAAERYDVLVGHERCHGPLMDHDMQQSIDVKCTAQSTTQGRYCKQSAYEAILVFNAFDSDVQTCPTFFAQLVSQQFRMLSSSAARYQAKTLQVSPGHARVSLRTPFWMFLSL